ncbi:MAG: hypothetical protein NVSMB39_0130 [Candidatus Saccharimonadales bacterium]
MNNSAPQRRPEGAIIVQIRRPLNASMKTLRNIWASDETVQIESELGVHDSTLLYKDGSKLFHILMNDKLYLFAHDCVEDVNYIVPADIPDLEVSKADDSVKRSFAKADKIYRNLAVRANYLTIVQRKETELRKFYELRDDMEGDFVRERFSPHNFD